MTNITSRLSGVALLALAVLPVAALSTAAYAAPAAVQIADINLSSPAGQAVYAKRVDSAANRFCRKGPAPLTEIEACRHGVRVEMGEKLDGAREAQAAGWTVQAAR